MTISIWRYSHLILAVSSFVFILLASITGVILAFEPISNKLHDYKAPNFDEVRLAETLHVLHQNYDEIIDLQVDANGFVLIDAITSEGETINGYIDPNTGNYLGKRIEKSKFFKLVTNFHRSLFLKSIGRLFIGITSFLLFLIAVSGTILIIKRQRSLKRFFSKIINENFAQYWHVVLGRMSLIPIILITLTGVYLSLLRFDIIPQNNAEHTIDYDNLKSTPKLEIEAFPALKQLMLKQVRTIEFPFSDDVEDFYTIRLKGKELIVNQFSGDIVSETSYPLVHMFSNLSVMLHTGEGSYVWSVVLAIACINILFFVYSGFAITLRRRKARLKNKYSSDDAEIVVLVGSENGSTMVYAKAFHDALLKNDPKSHIDELNNYKCYKNATDIVVITATYGQGDAPTNAALFLNTLGSIEQENTINYSVVGFGSLAYPDFCKYAFDVDQAMNKQEQFSQLLEVATINDRSFEAFDSWAQSWASLHSIKLVLPKDKLTTKPSKVKRFRVIEKTEPNTVDDTFLIGLKGHRSKRFSSGDLLAIYPKNDYRERLYSIGKIRGQIHLSVKLHEFGIGSNFLNDKQVDEQFSAKIIRNKSFHFPANRKQVIMIANGTGIAPFLGMIDENERHIETHLYWGGRTETSLKVYETHLQNGLKNKKLSRLKVAYSQQGHKIYVQDLLKKDGALIARTLQEHGVVMLCGSLTMQKAVLSLLEDVCITFNNTSLDHYIDKDQIRMDCY